MNNVKSMEHHNEEVLVSSDNVATYLVPNVHFMGGQHNNKLLYAHGRRLETHNSNTL